MAGGFFRRFFQDYTEEKLPGDDGKLHTRRTYRGFLYAPRLTSGQRTARFAGYTLLYLGGIALFILGGTARSAANMVWYVAVPSGISLFCALIEAIPMFSCVLAPTRQTVYQYKSGHNTCVLWARITAGAMALTALLSLLAAPLTGEALELHSLWYALACACEAAVGLVEAAIPYEKQTNPNA